MADAATKEAEPVRLTADEAEPCPFCGNQPVIQYWHGGSPQKRMISCDSECDVAPSVTGRNRLVALEYWNKRA